MLALVAGVALMQGTPCETEIAWTPQCATTSIGHVIAHVQDDIATSDMDGLFDGLAVAGACLAVLLAVLIGLAGIAAPGSTPARHTHPLVARLTSRRQVVRLAQLCVLRT